MKDWVKKKIIEWSGIKDLIVHLEMDIADLEIKMASLEQIVFGHGELIRDSCKRLSVLTAKTGYKFYRKQSNLMCRRIKCKK